MPDTRNSQIDRLRGLAIFLVIVGHCIQYTNGRRYLVDERFFDNVVFKFIYGVHMPLFMVLSGYLFSLKVRTGAVSDLLAHRIRTILMPIVAWQTIDFLIGVAEGSIAVGYGARALLKAYLITCVYGLWFLWAVFFNSVIVIIVCRWFKNSGIAYLLIAIAFFALPDKYNWHLYKYMYPFFVLPVLLRERGWPLGSGSGSRVGRFLTGSGCVALYCLSMYLWGRDDYIYTTGFSVIGKEAARQITIDLVRWATGLVGIVALVTLVRVRWWRPSRESTAALSWLASLGRLSLGIYALSGLVFTYLVPYFSERLEFSAGRVLVLSVVITLACAWVTDRISKHRGLNALLLGGRMRAG